MQRGHSMKVAPGHSAPTSESDDPAAVGFNRHLQFSRRHYGFPRQSALHPTLHPRGVPAFCVQDCCEPTACCQMLSVPSAVRSISVQTCARSTPAVRRDSAHSLSGATLSKDLSFFSSLKLSKPTAAHGLLRLRVLRTLARYCKRPCVVSFSR